MSLRNAIDRNAHVELPTLFDPDCVPRIDPAERTGTIAHDFAAFHAANPWVYTAIVTLARDLHQRGRERLGIKMLCEVVRWQYAGVTTDPNSDFRLNNNYTSRYARLIMAQEPDLESIFNTRELHRD